MKNYKFILILTIILSLTSIIDVNAKCSNNTIKENGKIIQLYYNNNCKVKKKISTYSGVKTIYRYSYFKNNKLKKSIIDTYYKNSKKIYKTNTKVYSYSTNYVVKKKRFLTTHKVVTYQKDGKKQYELLKHKYYYRDENLNKIEIKYQNGKVSKRNMKIYNKKSGKWQINTQIINSYSDVDNKIVLNSNIYYENGIKQTNYVNDYKNRITYQYSYNNVGELKSNQKGKAYLEKIIASEMKQYNYRYDTKGKLTLIKSEKIEKFNWFVFIPLT